MYYAVQNRAAFEDRIRDEENISRMENVKNNHLRGEGRYSIDPCDTQIIDL